MYFNYFPMKLYQRLILSAPWVGSSVVGICPSAKSRFIPLYCRTPSLLIQAARSLALYRQQAEAMLIFLQGLAEHESTH